jgi:hypothetical protein
MRFIDQPATVEWCELRGAPWGQKNNPIQHRRDCETVAVAAQFWATLPPDLAQIKTVDGIILHRADIENILRRLE